MFDEAHYVPILKARLGEFGALQTLVPEIKKRLTPLIEVPRVPLGGTGIQPHLDNVVRKLETAWGSERPFFLDLRLVEEESVGRLSAIEYVFEQTRAAGLQAIPVAGARRARPHLGHVRQVAVTDGRGACIRLEGEDFDGATAALSALLTPLGLSRGEADLLLDFKAISPGQGPTLAVAARSIIAGLPSLSDWRTLTLAASSFPLDLSGFPSGRISRTERAEWTMFRALIARDGARKPSFGDYAIQHPEPRELDPKIIRMTANLRYTSNGEWMLLKGRSVREHGYEQFHAICRALVQRPEYAGPDFSWGDGQIQRCAANTEGPGNASTWRKIGTSHHLAAITQQIASLRAPSGTP